MYPLNEDGYGSLRTYPLPHKFGFGVGPDPTAWERPSSRGRGEANSVVAVIFFLYIQVTILLHVFFSFFS